MDLGSGRIVVDPKVTRFWCNFRIAGNTLGISEIDRSPAERAGNGGSRCLQAPERRIAKSAALAAASRLCFLRCDWRRKKLVPTS